MKSEKWRGLIAFFALLIVGIFSLAAASPDESNDESAWPALTRESKPWAYWWWMGSAVDKTQIAENLALDADAGLGGLHIIPIYGVQGWEDRYLNFLSPPWMEMFAYTVAEADRRGLGVDLSTGTGWPFGGPQITPALAAKTAKIVKRGSAFAVVVKGTGQTVKRAAPGGAGLVMDHYSRAALDAYLERFDAAFANTPARPRAFYNDSFEVYGADWTDNLFDEFARRRGYDLREHLDALAGQGDAETVARVRCDYRETISDLLLAEFTQPWTQWAHRQGALTRNEAHGSPGNLLDLYAAADVPETETFGASRFPIPGLHYGKVLDLIPDRPRPLIMKFASSAAHVAGHRLVSSESCTWLGEHFTVTLAQIKPELDQLWLAGVNHIFFHGLPYSPTTEPWPGWLFYAETNFGPANTFWRDLPALNRYIAQTQAFLQAGRPDNDVLLYWPVHDLWSGVYAERPGQNLLRQINAAFKKIRQGKIKEFVLDLANAAGAYYETKDSKVMLFSVHNTANWLEATAFGQAAQLMRERGYSFDYVSDRMLAAAKVEAGKIITAGSSYSVVVAPKCRFMPVETLAKLLELRNAGATVVFLQALPEEPPGLASLPERREKMQRLRDEISDGRVLIGNDLSALLEPAGAIREPITDHGIGFIRRRRERGHDYFFANLTSTAWEGWTTLGVRATSAVIFDPLRQRKGLAALREAEKGKIQVYLQLEPGESLILRTFDAERLSAEPWTYLVPAGEPCEVRGAWRLEFLAGGPELPEPVNLNALRSWTELADDQAKCFSGAARYTIGFDLPAGIAADEWVLDLGAVRESARVTINGREAGVLFCAPFHLRVGQFLQPGPNRLELTVTNLPANRIIYMDRRRIKWRKFHDINYVNILGRPFNAATWKPLPSGLLGPITITPQKFIRP